MNLMRSSGIRPHFNGYQVTIDPVLAEQEAERRRRHSQFKVSDYHLWETFAQSPFQNKLAQGDFDAVDVQATLSTAAYLVPYPVERFNPLDHKLIATIAIEKGAFRFTRQFTQKLFPQFWQKLLTPLFGLDKPLQLMIDFPGFCWDLLKTPFQKDESVEAFAARVVQETQVASNEIKASLQYCGGCPPLLPGWDDRSQYTFNSGTAGSKPVGPVCQKS